MTGIPRGQEPVLDEDHIIGLLRFPIKPEHNQPLQAGAMQALLDLHTRKVTTEEFSEGASACVALYAHVTKLWLINHIHDILKGGQLTSETFERADRDLRDLIRKQAEGVIETVKRMQMHATPEDVIH